MVTKAHLQALGDEVRRRRIAKGIKTLVEFEEISGISRTYISGIENAYVSEKRGIVIPSDEVLDKIAVTLDIPISRLHALLGRFPDTPYPVFRDPESVLVAEAYDRLPNAAKQIVRDALRSAEKVFAQVPETLSGEHSQSG